jgi:hypothetical protein
MKRFVVERILPDAGNLFPGKSQAIAKTFCHIINLLESPYYRIRTFITDNKIYRIHIAEDEAIIREDSMLSSYNDLP